MKKIFTWVAAFMLCLALGLTARAEAVPQVVVDRAIEMLAGFESSGNYGCVTNDTNGCPSIGVIQWNDTRAVSLMKRIIEKDDAAARAALGEALYGELTGGKNTVWSGRALSKSERERVGTLLKTEAGRAVQTALARTDVEGYAKRAMGLGIRDLNALCYYCDIAHQVGSGAIVKYTTEAAKIAGGYEKITLDDLYQAALKYATHTKARRTKGYNQLKERPITGGGAVKPVLPTALTLKPAGPVSLFTNQTLALAAALKPDNAQASLQWKSANPRIATVKEGVVTPVGPGKTTIQVRTENGLVARVQVTVKPVPVKEITLSGDELMRRGARQTLRPSVRPSDATHQALRWRSGNRAVATVSQKGTVLARKPGKATIYCQAKDGSRTLAKFRITVTKK